MKMTKHQIIFRVLVADTIREIDDWHYGDLTSESFLERLEKMYAESFAKDFVGHEIHARPVQLLIDDLLRSYDLLCDPNASPRSIIH